MKKALLFIFLPLMLSCGHKDKIRAVDAVRFPPPVVKEDAEIADKNIGNSKDENIVMAKKSSDDAVVDESTLDATSPTGTQKADTSKKIVKEGDISFETSSVNETRKKIIQALKRLGGYVEEDNQSLDNDENRKEYTLKIRIPAKNFDFFLDSVSSTADKIDSKNISITDVTTRYIDITTRLANKKILENRYLDLLKKSSKVSDLLEIEDKLTDIRSDIESTQGQLNYLSKQVTYSSLSITFYTTQIVAEDKGEGFGAKFIDAIKDGADLVQKLFFTFIGIWPVWLCIVVIYIFFRQRKKRRTKQAA